MKVTQEFYDTNNSFVYYIEYKSAFCIIYFTQERKKKHKQISIYFMLKSMSQRNLELVDLYVLTCVSF